MGLNWSISTDLPQIFKSKDEKLSSDCLYGIYDDIEKQRNTDLQSTKITSTDIQNTDDPASYMRSISKEVFHVGTSFHPESLHEYLGPQSYHYAQPYKLNYNYSKKSSGKMIVNKFLNQ